MDHAHYTFQELRGVPDHTIDPTHDDMCAKDRVLQDEVHRPYKGHDEGCAHGQSSNLFCFLAKML